MNVQQQILESGKRIGMCQQFQYELSTDNKSVDELCSMYHRGLDFCIKHKFPNREIISQFRSLDLERNGIYYDRRDYDIVNQRHIVINGKSNVDVYVDDISDVYVCDDSVVRLHIRDNAFAYVTLYDKSKVSVVLRGKNTRICASVYSGEIVNEEQFDKIYNK